MNWNLASSNGQLSREFASAMFVGAICSCKGRDFDEYTPIGVILDMMLMGAEMNQ